MACHISTPAPRPRARRSRLQSHRPPRAGIWRVTRGTRRWKWARRWIRVAGSGWPAGHRLGQCHDQPEFYDRGRSVGRGPDLPVALHHAMMVSYQNTVWVIGGLELHGSEVSGIASARVFHLDDDNDFWVKAPALHHARGAAAAAVVGNKIVVVGGPTGTPAQDAAPVAGKSLSSSRWKTGGDPGHLAAMQLQPPRVLVQHHHGVVKDPGTPLVLGPGSSRLHLRRGTVRVLGAGPPSATLIHRRAHFQHTYLVTHQMPARGRSPNHHGFSTP